MNRNLPLPAWFVIFFVMLFAGGTIFLARGQFSWGVLAGSLITAAVITGMSYIDEKKKTAKP